MKIQKNQFLSTEGGLFEVLRIALPLIMGAAAHALNLLADRVMLSHYSEEAVAASLTGGLTGFTIACFFLGTIGFTGSFVAQYSGAGATERVGTAVWQGIFLSLIGGAILATGYFWAEPLFALFRHEPEVTAQEMYCFF